MRGSVKSRLESGPSAAQVLSLTPSRKGSRTVLGEENMVASLRGPVSLDAVGDADGVGLQMFVDDDFRKEVLAEVRDPYLRKPEVTKLRTFQWDVELAHFKWTGLQHHASGPDHSHGI